MSEEHLKFQIDLTGTYWGKRPQYSVWLDDQVIQQSEISQSIQSINFDRKLNYGNHSIKIRLENKDVSDTVVEDNKIIKDMLLNVQDIKIDDISLGSLLWSAEYHLDSPHEYQGQIVTSLEKCVNLGLNGTYILNFTTPFYVWLLEKL